MEDGRSTTFMCLHIDKSHQGEGKRYTVRSEAINQDFSIAVAAQHTAMKTEKEWPHCCCGQCFETLSLTAVL